MLQEKSVKRSKTPEQALASLQRLCARAERSSGDALRLMDTWNVDKNKRNEILQNLVHDKFIDDRRYAEAFVREKTSLSAWGEYKIRAALKRKGIHEEIINEVLSNINPGANVERLTQRLTRKVKSVKYETPYQLKTKLIRYGISLGFQMEHVLVSVEQVMKTNNLNNQCEEDIFF